MTAINHALTGSVIAFIVVNPLLALPAALLSHFVCDAIPHFGTNQESGAYMRSTFFKRLLIADAGLCVLLVLILALVRPDHWLLAAICAFLATTPDLLWIAKFRRAQRRGGVSNDNWLLTFAAAIQWFERPSGAIVEAAWLVAGIVMVDVFIR
jgi:hypothetical protein